MRKIMSHFMICMAVCVLLTGCSGSNFMVYKKGYHFYVTSSGEELKTILCDSGDLNEILIESQLSAPLQKELNESICGSNKVRERVLATLEGMTKTERTNLKNAFALSGYDINYIVNC